MNNEAKEDEAPAQAGNDASPTRTIVRIGAIVVAVQALLGMLVYLALDKWETRGQFGDMFGAVNTLFSGLAFAGLIYAIFLQRQDLSMQRKELQLQREELKMTREELARAATAQENAAEIASRQEALEIANSELAAIATQIQATASRAQVVSHAISGIGYRNGNGVQMENWKNELQALDNSSHALLKTMKELVNKS